MDGSEPPAPGEPPEGDPWGRDWVPEPWEAEGPAISISLGDATDIDPELLAAFCSPGGPGGSALGSQFGQGRPADALRPGPVLSALAEQAVDDLSRLTDDQLSGALQAARRLENRAFYLQARAVAEFARRRGAQRAAADARNVPPGRRPGENPDMELAAELLLSRGQAGNLLAVSEALATRLPRTLAGVSDGSIDATRASAIAFYTASLGDEDAAAADEILAAIAPQVRAETLARRAAALEMRLDPQAARDRKEHARQTGQRVEVRPELSGNASLAGRELAITDALASKANIHALALRLRRAGLAGTLDALRALVFNDLLQSRDPLSRIPAPAGDSTAPGRADPADPAGPSEPDSTGFNPTGPSTTGPGEGDSVAPAPEAAPGPVTADTPAAAGSPAPGPPAPAPASPAPVPALVNLLVPVGLLFGWDTAPAQAAGWGLLDGEDTRAIVQAASWHPATRWCMTVIGPDGTAIAHGCAAGQHPWIPGQHPSPANENPGQPGPAGWTSREGQGTRESRAGPGPARPAGHQDTPAMPDAWQAGRFADLIRRLNITLASIARGACDHAGAEDRYTPSRKLKHMVRARTATCTAPGCQAQAIYADLDHTVPHPEGATCQCNLGPKCRTHHRCKQAPGWKVEQPEPGVFRWTLPSGRAHTTRPTVYDP